MTGGVLYLNESERKQIAELRTQHPERSFFLTSHDIPTGADFFNALREGFTGIYNPDAAAADFDENLRDLQKAP